MTDDPVALAREFYTTPLGVAFQKFRNAHGTAWADDARSGYDDSAQAECRAEKSQQRADEAEKAFLELLRPLALRASPPVGVTVTDEMVEAAWDKMPNAGFPDQDNVRRALEAALAIPTTNPTTEDEALAAVGNGRAMR